MILRITLLSLAIAAAAFADTYPVILRGKVTLDDGTPPPFTVGIERSCSDPNMSGPGPITNKKGEWVWRLEFDPQSPNSCVFRATHQGWVSTAIDASNVNLTSQDTQATLPPLVITPEHADPYLIRLTEADTPGKAKGPMNKAMKALDGNNLPAAAQFMADAVAAAPKYADGWHFLGIVDERLSKTAEARDAYTHAIAADPKHLTSYITLAHLCVRLKDWQCTAQNSELLIKADKKRLYPQIYLDRAVAQYELKDTAGAEESIAEAIRLDPRHKRPREEYVEGRILEAKGDINGAREHMSKYLELDPNTPDAAQIRVHIMDLGKPGANEVEPELEIM